jgi:mannose-6-phosphate isomerase-like protein (cupin superfamily)
LWQHLRLTVLSWLYDSGSSSDSTAKTTTTTGTTSNAGSVERMAGTIESTTPSQRLIDKFRTPVKVSDLVGNPIPRMDTVENEFCGTHLELLSPDWALTPNLHVDVVTLPPSSELVPNVTEGVELYYVLKGDGSYSRNGTAHRISIGMSFIVDPGWYVGTTSCFPFEKSGV